MTTKYYDLDNIEVVPGDDWQQSYNYVNSDNQPINITGFTITFNLFAACNPTSILLSKNAILDDPTNGIFRFLILDSETANFMGDYEYSVLVTDSANITTTRIRGKFSFKFSVQNCGAC